MAIYYFGFFLSGGFLGVFLSATFVGVFLSAGLRFRFGVFFIGHPVYIVIYYYILLYIHPRAARDSGGVR